MQVDTAEFQAILAEVTEIKETLAQLRFAQAVTREEALAEAAGDGYQRGLMAPGQAPGPEHGPPPLLAAPGAGR